MMDWSEQEEQIMIEQAKAGDPEANYELSQWALRRGEEEPDEPRWNRLAAKCLVKAAQAGYGPAQKRMNELLASRAARSAAPEPEQEPDEEYEPERPVREPVRISDARRAAGRGRGRSRQDAPRPATTARRPASYDDGQDEYDDDGYARDEAPADYGGEYDDEPYYPEDEDEDDRPTRSLFSRARSPFANWTEHQWRRVEMICVGVCALLLVVITVMLITGRNRNANAQQGGSSIPPAEAVNPAASPTAEPVKYPDDETLAAIAAADLDIRPDDGEYMTVPTSATVRSGSTSLRLRKGPNTEYKQLTRMPDGTVVDVYAAKDNWCLVLYEDPVDGLMYGWCSSEYLIINTGAADSAIG